MRRLLLPFLCLALAACPEDEEAVCVRAYSDAIEPLLQRERALADEYARFLDLAETTDSLRTESRADLLDRYASLADAIDAVSTPCEAVTAVHALIEEAVGARRTSLERIVAVEGEFDEAEAVEKKLEAWKDRPEVIRRAKLIEQMKQQLRLGREAVVTESHRFVALAQKLVDAAGGTAPADLQAICLQSERLMNPLDRADDEQTMILVLRGGLERVRDEHAALLERAKAVEPEASVAQAWGEIVSFLEARQKMIGRFVELEAPEKEIRRLGKGLEDFDRLQHELRAVQTRVQRLLDEAIAKNRLAGKGVEEFEDRIKKLRARVL